MKDICKLPEYLERTTLDILAPQDYGGRSNDIKEALNLVRRNAEGLRIVEPMLRDIGVTLWSNCEVFSHETCPDGRDGCFPGPIERIKEQIAVQAPLVEKLICYQYQGIIWEHLLQGKVGESKYGSRRK